MTVEVKLGFCAIFFPFNKEATLGGGSLGLRFWIIEWKDIFL